VVDLQYRRLATMLLSVGLTRPLAAEEVLPDAWGIIDWVHRLDWLVNNLRGLPKHSAAVVDYLNASSLVENHRNSIQHLKGTIPAIEASGRSPWGHLCWTLDLGKTEDGGDKSVVVCAVSSQRGGVDQSYRLPELLPPRGPIDYISLFSADGEAEIGLTGQALSLVRFIERLQEAVAAAGPPGPKGILQIPI
jgi:hypothetical protein